MIFLRILMISLIASSIFFITNSSGAEKKHKSSSTTTETKTENSNDGKFDFSKYAARSFPRKMALADMFYLGQPITDLNADIRNGIKESGVLEFINEDADGIKTEYTLLFTNENPRRLYFAQTVKKFSSDGWNKVALDKLIDTLLKKMGGPDVVGYRFGSLPPFSTSDSIDFKTGWGIKAPCKFLGRHSTRDWGLFCSDGEGDDIKQQSAGQYLTYYIQGDIAPYSKISIIGLLFDRDAEIKNVDRARIAKEKEAKETVERSKKALQGTKF